ncbi:MAG: hypothetical protein SGI87_11590 [Flavobacteriales bacterium]|nr:hypothetical protein [Flavobacteriales bacterium]
MSLFFTLLMSIGYVLTLEREVDLTCTNFTTDELGYVYLICPDHIEKLDVNGDVMFRSSDLGLGDIFLADATNPLKPFVYYRDQNIIVSFDNTLSSQGNVIDLKVSDFGQIELVGASRDNSYWLWNTAGNELIRVNKDLERINTTPNLGVLTGMSIAPIQIIETATSVYLVDPKNGILEFDVFGTYRRLIPITFRHQIQVSGELIFYLSDAGNELHVLSISLVGEDIITLPSTPTGHVEYRGGRMFYVSGKKLQVYKVDSLRD